MDDLEVRDIDDALKGGPSVSPHTTNVNVMFSKHGREDNLAPDANCPIGRKRAILNKQFTEGEGEFVGNMETSDLIVKGNKMHRTTPLQMSGWGVFCTILGVRTDIYIYIYI